MKVSEQLLTSYLIDLGNLQNLLAGLSPEEVSSQYDAPLDLSFSLHYSLTQLTEQLTSVHKMQEAGWAYEDTLGLVDTPSTESK